MGVSRKKRLEQQRKLQETLTQTENRLRKVKSSRDMFRSRLDAAERRAAAGVQMPPDIMKRMFDAALDKASFELSKQMLPRLMDVRGYMAEELSMIKGGMLIRSDERGYMETSERFDTGDTHVTFTFPGFRWTQIIDRDLKENLLPMGGPQFRDNRDIFYTDEPLYPVRRYEGQAAMDTKGEVKVL